jgi:anti-sigma factor RsiW
MSPDDARALFSPALDGELDAATHAELQAAFAADPELAAEYAAFARTLELTRRAADQPRPTPNLLPRVQRRLRAQSRGRFYADRFAERAGGGMLQPVLLASALFTVLGLLWLVLHMLDLTRL